jgi:hypothetical protein
MMKSKDFIVNDKAKVAETENEVYIMFQGEYYVLNDTAKLIWTYITDGVPVKEIPELLYNAFGGEVDQNVLQQDCTELIEGLLSENILLEKV